PYSTVDNRPTSHGDLKGKEAHDSTMDAQSSDSTGKQAGRRKLYQRILTVILNWPLGKGFDPDGPPASSPEVSDITPGRWQTVRTPRPVKCSICSKVCTKHASPPPRPRVRIFENGVCSLHCPAAYHSSETWNSAPWHALCQLSAADIEMAQSRPFPWRENLDRCYRDEIDYAATSMRNNQEHIYRRYIAWGLRAGAFSMKSRSLCVHVFSSDAKWLADLSRSDIADLISLETAYRQSMQDRLRRTSHDVKIDNPHFQRAVDDHFAGHIRHPNDGSAVLSRDWVEEELRHPAGGA
ncbi:hypothetical protein GE09DRAFT_1155993, partial [Coniochaeta sp. 2T2.1]